MNKIRSEANYCFLVILIPRKTVVQARPYFHPKY